MRKGADRVAAVASTTPYDDVRYSNFAYAQTHPAKLATTAVLHGLDVPPPARARVLEIGCGGGANLIGIAAAAPATRALGIDLAPSVIEQAAASAAAVGLDNVEFRHADVRELAAEAPGEFDYVICHGMYAWVPEDARDALLAACRACLAPEGLAYVSYNAHPGGHLRAILRDFALWHAGDATGPTERAERARELFRTLLEIRVDDDPDPYGALLGHELTSLSQAPVGTLVHDLLGEEWRPVWFADFAAHCARHDLGYVGEARPSALRAVRWTPDAAPAVDALAAGDRVALEQVADMLSLRRFRESLLCRAGRPVDAHPSPDAMRRLRFSEGGTATDRDELEPAARALLEAVEGAPERTVAFDELRETLDAQPDTLASALLAAFAFGHVDVHAEAPPGAQRPGPRPRTSALARAQAAEGPAITSLTNTVVKLDSPEARTLIGLLDGTRDRAAIMADFEAATGLSFTPEALEENLESLAAIDLLHE